MKINVEIEDQVPLDVWGHLGPRALQDMGGVSPYNAVANSSCIWVARNERGEPLMAAGVVQDSVLGPAHMWFVMCTPFYKHKLAYLREMPEVLIAILRQFPYVLTYVDEQFAVGRKFVEWFGLKPVGMANNTVTNFIKYEAKLYHG